MFSSFLPWLSQWTTSKQYHSHWLASSYYTTTVLLVSSWDIQDVWVWCFGAQENIWPQSQPLSPQTGQLGTFLQKVAPGPKQLPSDDPWCLALMSPPGAHPGCLPFSVICHTRNMPHDQWGRRMTCSYTLTMEGSWDDGHGSVSASCLHNKNLFITWSCVCDTKQWKKKSLKEWHLGFGHRWAKTPILKAWKDPRQRCSVPYLTTSSCLALDKSFKGSPLQCSKL